MGMVVVEHPDGRRFGVDEADFNNPDANPSNKGGLHVDWDNNSQRAEHRHVDPRPQVDWEGLEDEGFVIVADIAEHDIVNPVTHEIDVHAGGEIPR